MSFQGFASYDTAKLDNGTRIGHPAALPHYRCAHPCCEVGSYDAPIDLPKCENCGDRFCNVHRVKVNGETWCHKCGECVSCGRPANQEGDLGLTCSPALLINGLVFCSGRLAAAVAARSPAHGRSYRRHGVRALSASLGARQA